MVEAITEIHKSNQDGKHENLMNDLANEKKMSFLWRQDLFRDNSGQGYGNKLRTYRLFKNIFNFEQYLSFGNYSQRKLLTQFRISAHDL